jgi:hypothetical protein
MPDMSAVYPDFLAKQEPYIYPVLETVLHPKSIARQCRNFDRAQGQKVVGSQTTVDKSRGGKICFIVKA